MTAAADGDLEAVVAGEVDRQRDVVGIGDADDERGVIVDVTAHDDARVVVFVIGGAGSRGPQGAREAHRRAGLRMSGATAADSRHAES